MVILSRFRLSTFSLAVSFALVGSAASASVVPVSYDPSEGQSAAAEFVSGKFLNAPEATTWAMMVLCVAGVGFAVFRRGPKGRLDLSAS
jgi:hypothetical protein